MPPKVSLDDDISPSLAGPTANIAFIPMFSMTDFACLTQRQMQGNRAPKASLGRQRSLAKVRRGRRSTVAFEGVSGPAAQDTIL